VDEAKEVFYQQNGPACQVLCGWALAYTGHIRRSWEWILKPKAGTLDPQSITNIRQRG
jgi:hypothetical protein